MNWSNATAASNRAVLEKATRGGARRGRAPGLVAYRDGEAVGWVGLSPREDYERLEHSVVERRQFNRSSPVRPIVRRGLRPRKRAERC
jgi:hypothetical protein